MTLPIANTPPKQDRPMTEQELDWLAEHIVRDRFLPCPPPDRIFVGDGAFLPIGAEFLKWFVRLGGLAPYERVLDLGCGIGRMAVPLTQYLEAGSYDGVDIVSEGIAWCTQNITSRYENFRFHRLDLAHAIYNPGGQQATKNLRLPFKDAAFDFVFMTSVVPHLHADEVRAYAREVRRVMAPDARFLVTTFMLNGPAREGLRAKQGAYPFDGAAPDPELHADPANPLAAVAFDEDFLLALFLEVGLRRQRPPVYGRWSGRATPGPSFQDINVLRIDPSIHFNAASGGK
jgi:SAM-dependent methyltransferase